MEDMNVGFKKTANSYHHFLVLCFPEQKVKTFFESEGVEVDERLFELRHETSKVKFRELAQMNSMFLPMFDLMLAVLKAEDSPLFENLLKNLEEL